MARPSIKAARTEEILQAYERCIALYGVEGATQQKIAAEAGIARPLLRHHVGNSADLLQMALKRFIERSEKSTEEAYTHLPPDCSGKDFIMPLFYGASSEADHNDTMIAAAFIYAAQTNPLIQTTMQQWLDHFVEGFDAQIQRLYPHADAEMVGNVSAGIIGIYFNVVSLAPLGTNERLRDQSYQAALYLLNTLSAERT